MPVTIEKDNGETHHGAQVKFVEWNGEELGSRVKQLHEEPQVGFSVMLDPQYFSYTWLTTPIKEIESDVEMGDFRCITFKTQNSNYKLYISGDWRWMNGKMQWKIYEICMDLEMKMMLRNWILKISFVYSRYERKDIC
jgi:hypothetical protein